MPELTWVGKEKVVNHHHDVPFRILKKQYTFGATENSGNRIVHGDNLEALKSLLPEYEGRVKCVYIDPPYNTGNENWVYNDNVNDAKMRRWLGQVVGKEGEDLSRHDKWLCMMYPRLKLLRKLLADDGVIFISIDDNEIASLRMILEEIFGKSCFVGDFVWQSKKGGGSDNSGLVNDHEYVSCFTKIPDRKGLSRSLIESEELNRVDDKGEYRRGRELNKWGANSRREDRPTMFFPIVEPDGENVYPIRNDGSEGRWRWGKVKMETIVARGDVEFEKRENDTYIVYEKIRSTDPRSKPFRTWLTDIGSTADGSIEIRNIFGSKVFNFPKPTKLIEHLINIGTNQDDDIVLDSFAGSGTTAHAVLKLNKADDGNRKFILIETEDYAETITAERVRRVMNGYGGESRSAGILPASAGNGEGGETEEKGGQDARAPIKKAVVGLGGAFDYYEMGNALFLEDGNLNETIGVDEIRRYVAYSENIAATHQTAIDNEYSPYLLGIKDDTAYFFYYEPDRATTLDLEFLSKLKIRPSETVFYADVCLLNKAQLQRYNIIFKKIPRDITRF